MTAAGPASTISSAVDDLFNDRRLRVEDAVDRHFAPTFRQTVNGVAVSRADFVALMVQARNAVEQVRVTVLNELVVGDEYAERHVIELVARDGTRTCQEVFVFARRDSDGRFARIDETSRSVAGG